MEPAEVKEKNLAENWGTETGLWISVVMDGNGEIILLNVLQFT